MLSKLWQVLAHPAILGYTVSKTQKRRTPHLYVNGSCPVARRFHSLNTHLRCSPTNPPSEVFTLTMMDLCPNTPQAGLWLWAQPFGKHPSSLPCCQGQLKKLGTEATKSTGTFAGELPIATYWGQNIVMAWWQYRDLWLSFRMGLSGSMIWVDLWSACVLDRCVDAIEKL